MGFALHEMSAGFRQVLIMWVISAVVAMVMLGCVSEAKCEFEAIFNFGDSNSDTGGFWAAFPTEKGPFGITYFKKPAGRASDGGLVIDFLAFLVELPHSTSNLDTFGCMISYNKAVADYNNMLKDTLQQTRKTLPNASVIYVDTHSIYLDLFKHPTNYGLKYGTRACCGSGGGDYNFDPQVFCGNSKLVKGRNVTATACGEPNKYVSWDGIHSTEAANKIVTFAILNGSYFYPPFPIFNLCDLQPIG